MTTALNPKNQGFPLSALSVLLIMPKPAPNSPIRFYPDGEENLLLYLYEITQKPRVTPKKLLKISDNENMPWRTPDYSLEKLHGSPQKISTPDQLFSGSMRPT